MGARDPRAPRAGSRRLEGSLGRRASVSVRDTSRVSRRHGCANQRWLSSRGEAVASRRADARRRERGGRAHRHVRPRRRSVRDSLVRASARAVRRRALQPLASRPLRGSPRARGHPKPEDEHDPWASLFRHSEVPATTAPSTRSFRAPRSVVSCTPPSAVLGGPTRRRGCLAGARWPVRGGGTDPAAAERGDDPAASEHRAWTLARRHGRTLSRPCQRRARRSSGRTRPPPGTRERDGDGDANGMSRTLNEIENDPGDEARPGDAAPFPSVPGRRARVVIDGRVAATATRLSPRRRGRCARTLSKATPDAPPEGVLLLAADLDNWAGRAREDDSRRCRLGCRRRLGGADRGRVRRARAERGCVGPGLGGSFNRAEIRDADGVSRTSSRTPPRA